MSECLVEQVDTSGKYCTLERGRGEGERERGGGGM